MEKFYFTFGNGHEHENKYVVIETDDYEEAREEMFSRFGNKWAFQYTEDEWTDEEGFTIAEDWDLAELK